jgi:Flp pilus assembly protein TadD/TolB-like protein
VLLGAVCAQAQNQGKTLVILPFENASGAPGLEWIGEAFPEVLGPRMASATLYVVGRDDRLYAFDRMGIPAAARPSRATIYKIVQAMDVDYAVLGRYEFDGRTFTATAQLLDVKSLRLGDEVKESGPLVKLLDVQNALAWDLLRQITPNLLMSRNDFVALAPPVRLDALENYIRGAIAGENKEKVRYFREAVRRNPAYYDAMLALGKMLYETGDHQASVGWLARIPRNDALAREAHFYLGLDYFYLGQYDRAQYALEFLASRLPLTEVHNNLGVMAARRGDAKAAVEHFRKAAEADPRDADYHFNLGVALARTGEPEEAGRELRRALELTPEDTEVQSVLENLAKPQSGSRQPQERIKLNYDESSYRQMAIQIQNVNEQRLASVDPVSHARFHTERGQSLYDQGFVLDAEGEFREAVVLDPTNAAAHAGLAAVLERLNDASGARAEARAALRLAERTDALLVLARLDLRENRVEAAAESVAKALAIEPQNAEAAALQRTVASRLAEKAPAAQKP